MTLRARPLDADFFAADTLEVARRLVGVTLEVGGCSGVIVEVEAYKDDAASHFVTRRKKAALMGTTHGAVYVYKIYGLHHCLNFTTDRGGPGAVLIRALEPREGIEAMRRRRGVERLELLCSGPARLVQALDVDPAWNGRPVTEVFRLLAPRSPPPVATSPRIGISEAADLPWRFFLPGSPYLSRKTR